MAHKIIQATVVNHVGTDIAAQPDDLWRVIVDSFIACDGWRAQGYSITPLDDPSAPLGGYHMRLEQDGALVDERVVRVTERDDAARRLSLAVDFLSAPDGVLVYATYQAPERADGTRYAIDCHTRMGIELPADGGPAEMATAIDAMRTQFATHLTGYVERVRDKLEAVKAD